MADKDYFKGKIAERYDNDHSVSDPAELNAAIDLLADLTADGSALEFAIGTGRIALPLQARGIEVEGIELSRDMVAQLRSKPGGDGLKITIGDMSRTRVEGQFSLVFLVFNTINNLTSQDAQLACFENAAAHLASGGRFLIEVLVPPLQRLPLGQDLLAFDQSPNHWGMDVIDVTTQKFTSHHTWFEGEEYRSLSISMRYVWPSELDLMARIAGMELEHRWQDWLRTPFSTRSERHVSVWRKV